MPGNHQVLVGPYHISADPAVGRTDAPAVLLVGRFVQLEPQPSAGAADSAPHRRRILPDPGGENDPIEAAERRGERRNMAGNAITKYLDREAGTRVVTGQELAEIRRNTREAQHARAF